MCVSGSSLFVLRCCLRLSAHAPIERPTGEQSLILPNTCNTEMTNTVF